jgi:hypothetical protein
MTLFQRFKRLTFWNKLGVIASVLTVITFVVWLIPERSKPRPHFTLSLQIGDSPSTTLFLTNDFLFSSRIVKVGDLPNGAIKFNGFANGCLVIPVQQWESNKVFHFIAENDSPVKVTDLEVAVGFPKEWKCSFDSKWHEIDESLIIPGAWKFEITNMQFVAAQSPWVLFPYDSLSFPAITNPCIPEYIGSTYKGGFVEVSIRSTEFENILAANVLFLPATSNFSKPFVTLGKIGSDGLLRLPVTEEEFEKSQK